MSAPVRDARSLFAAARADGPTAQRRDAVYREVALATGLAAAAAATTATGLASGASGTSGTPTAAVGTTATFSVKLIAIGALLGAVATGIGVFLALTFGGGADAPARLRAGSEPVAHAVATGARLGGGGARARDANDGNADADAKSADGDAKAGADARASASAKADWREGPSDLAEEARLVTAARNALVAGDAARALSLVQATRKLGARALEPEELGLEARALRALGRADDAAATELVLKRRYPESALAR